MVWLWVVTISLIAATYLCSETTFKHCQYLSAHKKMWKVNIKPLSLSFIFFLISLSGPHMDIIYCQQSMERIIVKKKLESRFCIITLQSNLITVAVFYFFLQIYLIISFGDLLLWVGVRRRASSVNIPPETIRVIFTKFCM